MEIIYKPLLSVILW